MISRARGEASQARADARGAGARTRSRRIIGARRRVRATLRRPDPGTMPWNGSRGPIRTRRSPLGSVSRGAKVDGVALGLRAFGVMTALGLNALGLTDEAGALGLIRLGPVAAGAEPGIGT